MNYDCTTYSAGHPDIEIMQKMLHTFSQLGLVNNFIVRADVPLIPVFGKIHLQHNPSSPITIMIARDV